MMQLLFLNMNKAGFKAHIGNLEVNKAHPEKLTGSGWHALFVRLWIYSGPLSLVPISLELNLRDHLIIVSDDLPLFNDRRSPPLPVGHSKLLHLWPYEFASASATGCRASHLVYREHCEIHLMIWDGCSAFLACLM